MSTCNGYIQTCEMLLTSQFAEAPLQPGVHPLLHLHVLHHEEYRHSSEASLLRRTCSSLKTNIVMLQELSVHLNILTSRFNFESKSVGTNQITCATLCFET